MTEKEALKLALEALKYPLNQSHENFNVDMAELLAHRAITAIKEALAQPEQEPVAHTLNCVCGAVWDIKADGSEEMVHTPDTTPPQRTWFGLTDEEINKVLGGDIHDEPNGLLEFVRAIEAKLKEKNT